MIRISGEARRVPGTLSSPEGEVLRLMRPSEALGVGRLTFCHGRGSTQVPRIDPELRKGHDGSTVEVGDVAPGVVPPWSLPG